MTVLTVKVPEPLDRRLRQLADDLGATKSAVARKAIEEYLDGAGTPPVHLSAYDMMGDHVGRVDGPTDLATSSAHMAEYGR